MVMYIYIWNNDTVIVIGEDASYRTVFGSNEEYNGD